MTFLGWCLLCIFLPTGMQAIPFNLGAEWYNRPIPMKEEDFKAAKAELAKKIKEMMAIGKKLIDDKKRLADTTRNMWMIQRWRQKSTLKSEQHQFETNCIIAEREFQRLDKISGYRNKVEPLIYSCKLILAIVLAALSLVMLIHWFCYCTLKVDERYVEPFLNDFLEQTEDSALGFLASVIILGIGFFLCIAALNGNIKLGLRFFFVSFYPILPKETFVNSFFANCLVMNLWMSSLTQFMSFMFRGYLRGTQVAKIFDVQVNNMYFFSWFFQQKFFVVWTMCWWGIALFYLILKPVDKIYLG